MKSILKIALGIIAALGGFLDIGDIVFTTQAGALYRYDLLWAVVLGTIGIAVYPPCICAARPRSWDSAKATTRSAGW